MDRFFQQWMRHFGFAAFFSLFINTLQLVFPIYMLLIYDKVFASHSMPTLITVSVGALLALLVYALLDFLRSRLLIRVAVAVDKSLTRPVIAEMLRDAVRVDTKAYRDGILDINTMRNFLSGNAAFSFFDLPWVPVYLAAIFCMSSTLGWLAIGGAVIIIVLGVAQELLTGPRFTLAKTVEREAGQLSSLGLRNAETLVAMNMVPGFIRHWMVYHEQKLYLQTKANLFASLLNSISRSFRTAMQVAVYGVGAYLVLENEATAGVMIAASIIIRQATGPVDQIMSTWKQTVEARGAYKRLRRLLEDHAAAPNMELPAPAGALQVEAVSLNLQQRPVLKSISFTLNAGESLGLIGPSGAGKSCLCRLLLGIWSPSSGIVRLDGADLQSWNRDALGRHIGYLPQDVELFEGSVSDNIARMGEVDPEQVVLAAQYAGIHEMILRLPQGYDTPIDALGMNLSGGQRQLIGLARVFYGEPRLVILDEPNSNLDDQGERFLLHAMQQLKARGATTIMVTHKPSLLTSVDRLLLLRDGAVALFGPRDEVFQAIAAAQAGKTR